MSKKNKLETYTNTQNKSDKDWGTRGDVNDRWLKNTKRIINSQLEEVKTI